MTRQPSARGAAEVVIVTPLLTRANGGSSTALDVAEGLHSLGVRVHMMLTDDSPWVARLTRRQRAVTSLPGRSLRCVQLDPSRGERGRSGTGSARQRRASGGVKAQFVARIKKTLKWLNRRMSAREVAKISAQATLVIDAGVGLGHDLERARRSFPAARFVMNHNGSVEAFEIHFLGGRPESPEANRDRYLHYIGGYDFLLFQSSDVADEVVSIAPQFVDRHRVVSPSCQEPAVLGAHHQPSPFPAATFPIVVVASVQPRKGQEDAIRALALLDTRIDASLHFVGPVVDDSYVHEIRELAGQLGVSGKVHIHGLRSDYLRYLAHAGVVLQPSSAEGVSRVLREAMLLERPIVAYAIPGTGSVLTNGVDALLVPRGEIEALGAAITRVMHEPAVAASLSAEAGATYRRNHSWSGFLLGLGLLVQETHPESAVAVS